MLATRFWDIMKALVVAYQAMQQTVHWGVGASEYFLVVTLRAPKHEA